MTIRDRIEADLLAVPMYPTYIQLSPPAYRALLACCGTGGVHRVVHRHNTLGAVVAFGIPCWLRDDIEGETYRMVFRKAKRKV